MCKVITKRDGKVQLINPTHVSPFVENFPAYKSMVMAAKGRNRNFKFYDYYIQKYVKKKECVCAGLI